MAQQDDSAGVVVEVGEERLLIPEGFEPVDEFPMTEDDSVGFDRRMRARRPSLLWER